LVNEVRRMIELRPTRWLTKKKLVITGATLVGIVVFAIGAWWLVANYSMGTYQKALDANRQAIKQALAADAQQLKNATDDNQRLQAINKFIQDARARLTYLPQLPVTFGITAGGGQDKTTHVDIESALKGLVTAADKGKQMFEYQLSVATNLSKVTSLPGKNADEQKAMADAWAALLAALKGMSPPDLAKDSHQQLITAVANVQAIVATMPDLFTKKDINAFSEKQTALDAAIRDLRKLSTGFASAAAAQDQSLVTSYATLRDHLH
jgi:hypothetical protein